MEIKLEKRMKGRAATWKRYPTGEEPEYDKRYFTRRAESHILNKGLRTLWDIGRYDNLQGLKNELYEYLGDDIGELDKDTDLFSNLIEHKSSAIIPELLDKLDEISQQVKNYIAEKQMYGFPKVEEPSHLKTKRFEAEALLDIRLAEAEYLQKEIKKHEDKKAKEVQSKVLPYGPQRSSIGSPPREVDGQNVRQITVDEKGKPINLYIIDDCRSPYDGMGLHDYYKMGAEWSKERDEHDRELRKKRDDEILKTGSSKIHIPLLSSRPSKDSFPTWPKDAINYKKIKE